AQLLIDCVEEEELVLDGRTAEAPAKLVALVHGLDIDRGWNGLQDVKGVGGPEFVVTHRTGGAGNSEWGTAAPGSDGARDREHPCGNGREAAVGCERLAQAQSELARKGRARHGRQGREGLASGEGAPADLNVVPKLCPSLC